MMRPRRWLAWKCVQVADWLHVKAVLWLSWEQGIDAFACRYCGKQVDVFKPYHSDERGFWHWDCGALHR